MIVVNGDTEQIKEKAFKGCTRLKTIVLKPSVKYIGYETFEDCPSLKDIYVSTTTPPVTSYGAFSSAAYEKAVLYVPVGSRELYSQTGSWENFEDIRETDEDPAGIGELKSEVGKIIWLSRNEIECRESTLDYFHLSSAGCLLTYGKLYPGERLKLTHGILIIDRRKYMID